MNQALETLIGHGRDLNSLQMICRAIISFFITLLFLRIAGVRTFGKRSAFDNVIIIMLGSILSRIVVGASPMIPTILACLVFVVIHSMLGWLGYYNDRIGRMIKGEASLLFSNGMEHEKNMKRTQVSRKDLLEAVRKELHQVDFEQVKEIYLERSGDLSVIKKT